MKASAHLLDANVLIALAVQEHVHHRPALAWVRRAGAFALCPITEGALVRFLLRSGEARATATTLMTAFHTSPRCEFWAGDLSYVDVPLERVGGHRQVTDAYLVALARARGGRLATLDRGLAQAHPDDTTLVPTSG